MNKFYISGAITGLDHAVAFEKFERAEGVLRGKGFEPVNPMKSAGQDQSTICKCGHLNGNHSRVNFRGCMEKAPDEGPYSGGMTCKCLNFTPAMTWEEYMREDIKILMDCDGIYMLENWAKSKGACIENYIANCLGMTVLYEGLGTFGK